VKNNKNEIAGKKAFTY